MVDSEKPYRLHAIDNWIAITGPDEAGELLARSTNVVNHDGWWWLPASDDNCLLVEALWPISEATDNYRLLRHSLLGLSESDSKLVESWLVDVGLNPEDFCDYQRSAILIGAPAGRLYNASEPGTGKTRVALALAAIWRCRRSIVLATSSGADEWIREAGKINFPGLVEQLTGSLTDRGERLLELASSGETIIAVSSYDAFSGATKPSRSKSKRRTISLLHAAMKADLHCLILDESWKIKSPESKWTKQLLDLSKIVPRAQALSGTPVGNSSRDLFPQFKAIGAINDTLEEFEGKYVIFKPVFLGASKLQKAAGGKSVKELLSRVKSCWFRVVQEGLSGSEMPPAQPPILVTLDMSSEHRRLYDKLKSEGLAAIGQPLSLSGKPVVDIRLCQLVGGSVPMFDDLGNQSVWKPESNRKLDWLENYAKDTWLGNPSRRGIVWCRWNQDVADVTETLRRVLKRPVAAVVGAEDNFDLIDDPMCGLTLSEVKDSFNSRSYAGVQVIVAQVSKLCSSANLQAGDDAIHYTHTWSYIEWVQASYRNRRKGRSEASFTYQLCYIDSKDEDVLAAQRAKKDFALQAEVESYRDLLV